MTIPTDTTDVNQEKVEAYMKEKSMYMWRAYRGQVAEEFQSLLQVNIRFVTLSDNRLQTS